jgi:hypothetical protein
MNTMKKVIVLLLSLSLIRNLSAVEEQPQAQPWYQCLAKHDPRFFVLTLLGAAAGGLGLWIIKQSVDKILAEDIHTEEISLREKLLALGSQSLATLIGLACTIGGGMLIITDSYTMSGPKTT